MLIVRRRAGQAVLIGDLVEIHVLEIAPGRVKLGVVAPREIPVLRAEVKLTRETNLAAAQGVPAEKLAELVRRLRGEAPRRRAAAPGAAGEPSEQP